MNHTVSSRRGVLSQSPWDGLLIGLSLLHAALLAVGPPFWVVAGLLWWNANTISHNFIHRPFFAARGLNHVFSLWLTLLLGVPQSLWKQRHLAHHAERPWRLRWEAQLIVECVVLANVATLVLTWRPEWFMRSLVPGWLLGMTLCWLQGWFEHVRGATSHYGWLYNLLFLNDGYHVEHHARPQRHWTELRRNGRADAHPSRWPAVLRWLEWGSLDALERLALRSRWLQRLLLQQHERAFRKLLGSARQPDSVCVVGGGLFPRTAMVLRRIFPGVRIRVVEGSAQHLEEARQRLHTDIDLEHRFFDRDSAGELCRNHDLLVIPLAFRGDRAHLYREPPAPRVLIHDWLWRRGGRSSIVSIWLLKRVNLMTQ